MLILVKMLAKYFIIIYALGSVHEKFGVWIKAVPKPFQSRSTVEIPGRARCVERTPNFSCTWFNVLGLPHEKIGIWTEPKIVVRI